MNSETKVSEFIDGNKILQLDNLKICSPTDVIDKIRCVIFPINNIGDKLV